MSSSELDVLVRAVIAGMLGYLVGLEREYVAHREAGSSTFGLIAMAAAVVTSLASNVFGTDAGSRVVANIMVGVGFLGGGTIVKETRRIKGLTTAAGIWAMASVGMVVGSGQIVLGVAISVFVLLLFSAEHLERWVRTRIGGARSDRAP